MELEFLNRAEEVARLDRFCRRPDGSLAIVYGRRRCGKSRLLLETLPSGRLTYYVADEREAALQRRALAAEVARRIPGFDRVVYPDWDDLLARWWQDAPAGSVMVLDEFPALVAQSPELPSLLQRRLDRERSRGVHLVLCGSSQRMMHSLVLHRSAPLYGRAVEILKIEPLEVGWIQEALGLESPRDAVEAFGIWGGVPRYWELAADFPTKWDAA